MPEPFNCENRRFRTDTAKENPHGRDTSGAERAAGSVFPEPLAGGEGDLSLWLEYVVDKEPGDGRGPGEAFWLMWYDANGRPTIRTSGVFSRKNLRDMAQKLIQVPS